MSACTIHHHTLASTTVAARIRLKRTTVIQMRKTCDLSDRLETVIFGCMFLFYVNGAIDINTASTGTMFWTGMMF
jgi:hypothetical protein